MVYKKQICEYCSSFFVSTHGRGQKCCSQECSTNNRHGEVVNYPCLECSTLLQKRENTPKKRVRKFCSRDCSAKHLGRERALPNYCTNCEKLLSNSTRKFCSHSCQHGYARTQYIKDWKQGVISGQIGVKYLSLSSVIRNYLLRGANFSCSKCGWDEKNPITGKCSLDVNHIDGNSNNNRPENLEVICPNCHSLTPNYKSLNWGNGRKNRK